MQSIWHKEVERYRLKHSVVTARSSGHEMPSTETPVKPMACGLIAGKQQANTCLVISHPCLCYLAHMQRLEQDVHVLSNLHAMCLFPTRQDMSIKGDTLCLYVAFEVTKLAQYCQYKIVFPHTYSAALDNACWNWITCWG